MSETVYQLEVKYLENGDAEIFGISEMANPSGGPNFIITPPLELFEHKEMLTPDPLVKSPNALERFLGITMKQKIARRLKKFDKVYNRE